MAQAEYHPWSGGIEFCETINNTGNNPFYINAQTYFQQAGNVLSLYVNGTLVQSWTGLSLTIGRPIGLLMALTYSN